MNSLIVAIDAVAPLIIIMVIGLFLNKANVVDEVGMARINKLLFRFFLPILVFKSVYNADIVNIFTDKTIIFLIIFAIISFVIYYYLIMLVDKSNKKRAVMLQGIVRTSALIFGLPLASNILDNNQLGIVSIAATITIPFNNVLPTLGFTLYTDYKPSFKEVVKKIILNPIVIGMLSGLLLKQLRIEMPIIVYDAVDKLAGIGSPLALLVIGGTFKFKPVHKMDSALIFTIINKVFVLPAIALIIAYLIGLRDAQMMAVLVVTSGPTSISSYPQTVAANGDIELANDIIVYTMITSIFTAVTFLTLLNQFQIINI